MILTVHDDPHGGVNVWAGLEGSDPRADAFGFIIGTGETRDDAINDALRSIARAVGELKQLEEMRKERLQ
jgi:hypothetical protein